MKYILIFSLLACTPGWAEITVDGKTFTAGTEDSPQQKIMAKQLWADQLCGGAGAYRDDAKKFEECTNKKLSELNEKRLSAVQSCGGFLSFKKDSAKYEACVGKKISGPKNVTAEDIWADQRCGGNAAYMKNSKEFEFCLKEQKNSPRTSLDYMWAEQQCGGAEAYRKDTVKFEACVKQKTDGGSATVSKDKGGVN
jgi:hypothetical protein